MKPYSLDLRLKVLDAVDCGIPKKEVVGTFGVSMPTIDRYLRQRRQTGEIAPGRTPRRTPLICATIEERRSLWRQLEENDAATLERHCELWESKQRVRISVSTMCRAVRKLGWTKRPGHWEPPNEAKRTEVLGQSA
ncbi:MAG TPA: IS630 transposase-related protein [Rubrobacter sp.]|nr:IS630 transposase-related protein [Rubrobacter sp.]